MTAKQPYIFIVDDDEDDIEILTSSLVNHGIKVKSFDGGLEAVSYLKLSTEADWPSLIILDFDMPEFDGLQVLLFIMSNEATKDIPVVMYSANKSPLLKKACLELGAWEWFTKPYSQNELDERVAIFKNLAYSLIDVDSAGIKSW